MTLRRQFPVSSPGTGSTNLVEDDESLSPSDGYFGDRGAQVPNAVFVPISSAMEKEQEAASEHFGGSRPEKVYTPQTTGVTPASSRRDSSSTHNDFGGRYRDTPRNALLEEEDAPPEYSETLTSEGEQTSPALPQQSQYRDSPHTESDEQPVRETVTPSPEEHVPGSFPLSSIPQSFDDPVPGVSATRDTSKRKRGFGLPMFSERPGRRCEKHWGRRNDKHWGRRNDKHWGRRNDRHRKLKCALFLLLVIAFLALSLGHVKWYRHWIYRRPPHPPPPPGITPGRPPGTVNRKYTQHETSNSIKGTYHLYDLMDLKTTSGSVNITVIAEPAASNRPVDDISELRISTNSGSINLKMITTPATNWLGARATSVGDLNHIPPRTFRISLSTNSGSVQGNVLVGGPNDRGVTSISTKSGSINLEMYPIIGNTQGRGIGSNSTSELLTQTNSGSQTISVKSPIPLAMSNKPAPPSLPSSLGLDQLDATHLSHGSGSINIRYPENWLGIVHAKSHGSGSVHAEGPGLEYGLKGSREIYAWRGRGDELRTVSLVGQGSGSIRFNC